MELNWIECIELYWTKLSWIELTGLAWYASHMHSSTAQHSTAHGENNDMTSIPIGRYYSHSQSHGHRVYCIGFYSIALHCVAVYRVVLYSHSTSLSISICTVLYGTALQCTVLYCGESHGTALNCATLRCITISRPVQVQRGAGRSNESNWR